MKRLNKTLAIAALAAAAFASASFAAGEPDPVLKVDYLNSDLPADYFHANFRTPLDPFPQSKFDALGRLGYSTKVSREGMDQIHAAGGADIAKPKRSFKSPKLETEEELVKSAGASYYRLATTNHFRPDDHEVDLYVDFMKKLHEDRWLFIHCCAGEGRTTNFMVMTDIFKNYKKASFDDIAARQGLIGPVDARAELAVAGKTHYKMKASVERRIFLEQFYLYAKDTDFSKPWSQWARARGISLKYYLDF